MPPPTPTERATGRPLVSLLIPVKDEEGSLQVLADQIIDALAADPGAGAWEVVFIDDGSTDSSWAIIESLVSDDERFRGLRLRRNFGKSAALAVGLERARGDVLVTLDADLQDDPAEIPGMLALLDGPVDLVAGHKVHRRDPLGKRLPSKVFNSVTSWVTGLKLHDHNCGLKVARREVLEEVPLYGEMHRFIAAIAHSRGFRITEQGVNHRPREHGRSKFGLERYVRGGLDLLTVVTLTRYDRRPAHLFGGLGLLLGSVGVAILLYLTGVWALTDQGIGDRPLLLLGVLLLLVSVQLASVGLLAELSVHHSVTVPNIGRHVVASTDHRTAEGRPPPRAPHEPRGAGDNSPPSPE